MELARRKQTDTPSRLIAAAALTGWIRITDAHAKLYNNCYLLDGIRLGGEIAYDISDTVVGDFIKYVELCTDGRIIWLIGAFVEINGWGNIKKIEAAIASDPDLKECAYIEQIL